MRKGRQIRISRGIISFLAAVVAVGLGAAPAAAQTLAPGTDLARASASAADGATLRLAAGEYPGTIILKGKRLTVIGAGGGTVLTGGRNQMLVHVTGKAKLKLSGVTFRPRAKDGFAVYVSGAEATVGGCTVERATQPAFYVKGGSLTLDDCSLHNLVGDGIVGTDGANLAISRLRLDGAGKAGVVVARGTQATISDSVLAGFGSAGIFVSDKSRATVSKSTLENAKGRGVAAQKASTVRLDGVTVRAVGGSAVLGLGGSTVTIARGTFTGAKRNAVHFQGGGALRIDGTRFDANPQAVVVLGQKAKPEVHLTGNTVTGTPVKKAALVLQNAGSATLTGNVVIGDGTALSLRATAGTKTTLRGNTLIARSANAATVSGGTIEIAGNRVVSGTRLGLLLTDGAAATLADNVVLAGGNAPVWLQKGATLDSEGNAYAGVKQAIVTAKSAGPAGRMGDDLKILGLAPPAAAAKPAATPPAAGSPEAAAATALAAALAATPTTLAPFDAAIGEIVGARDALLARLRVMAHLSLRTEDRFGKPFPSGFVVEDQAGAKVADVASASASARLPPGSYRVVPDFDRRLVRRVTLGQSERKTVTVRSRAGIAFDVAMHDNKAQRMTTVPVLLHFDRGRGGRRVDLVRPSWHGAARANAAPEEIAAALALARSRLGGIIDELKRISSEYSKGSFDQARFKALDAERTRWDNASWWARGILAAFGEDADVAMLLDLIRAKKSYEWQLMEVAAQIEARLGRLTGGRIAALLDGPDAALKTSAAIVLRLYGHSLGKTHLDALAADPSTAKSKYRIFDISRDRRDPDLLAAARATIAAFEKDRAGRIAKAKNDKERNNARFYGPWIPAARKAAEYLVLHGNRDDLKLASRVYVDPAFLVSIMPALSDPAIAVDVQHGRLNPNGYQWNIGNYVMERYCRAMDRLDPAAAVRVNAQIERAVTRGAVSRKIVRFGARESAMVGRWLYRGTISRCRPNVDTARFLFKSLGNNLRAATWFRKEWQEADAIARFAAGDGYQNGVVQHADPATLAAALAPGKTGPDLKHPELFLAWHRLIQNICRPESCPFSLVERNDPQGSLVGRLTATPSVVGNRLRLALALDTEVFRNVSLATMIENSPRRMSSFTRDRGRPLIRRLALYRGTTKVAAQEIDDPLATGILYGADLGEDGLRGLTLEIELAMFDSRTVLNLPLYMSESAIARNRAAARLEVAAAAAKATPEKALAQLRLGRALEDLGRLDAADAAFEAFAALKPDEPKIWPGIAAMYRKNGEYDAALGAFDRGLKRFPSSVSLIVRKANLQYTLGRYAPAAESFATAAGAAPRQAERWRWWQAANNVLAGAFADASAYLRAAPAKYQPLRTKILRYASAVLGRTDDAGAARQTLAAELDRVVRDGANPEDLKGDDRLIAGIAARIVGAPKGWKMPKAGSARERCFRGVYAGLDDAADPKRKKQAIAAFKAALGDCGRGRLEYRLAAAGLEWTR